MTTKPNYEPIDQIVVSLSREIKDKESCYTGIAIPSAVVAVQLARRLHAPNLKFLYGGYWISPDLDMDLFSLMTDEEEFKKSISKAEGFSKLIRMYQYWEGPMHTLSFGMIRPAQIDKYGNVNNSLIGDPKNPKFRFPGGAAVGDIMNVCKRVLVYIPRHDKRTFVEKVDFVTSRGGSPEWRKQMGLTEFQGISVIVTDLAILDINQTSGIVQVRSIHEYSSIEEVQENTGFDLDIPTNIPTTNPPNEKELEALQNEVDPMSIRNFDSRSR
jgi:glutaconate CoA-transferase subunit B